MTGISNSLFYEIKIINVLQTINVVGQFDLLCHALIDMITASS